jgi:hypothetical protein
MRKLMSAAAVMLAVAPAALACQTLRQRERAAINANAARQGARVMRCHPGEGGGSPGFPVPSVRDLLCSERTLRIAESSPVLRVQFCAFTMWAHERRNGTIRVSPLDGFSCILSPGVYTNPG